MNTESKARALYEKDRARIEGASPEVFPNVGKSWEEVDGKTQAAYYEFVAQGDYDIEFEEENND